MHLAKHPLMAADLLKKRIFAHCTPIKVNCHLFIISLHLIHCKTSSVSGSSHSCVNHSRSRCTGRQDAAAQPGLTRARSMGNAPGRHNDQCMTSTILKKKKSQPYFFPPQHFSHRTGLDLLVYLDKNVSKLMKRAFLSLDTGNQTVFTQV